MTSSLGIAGIVVWHLQGSSRPKGRLAAQILFFIGMCVALYGGGVYAHRIDDIPLQGVGAVLAKSAWILWWIHLAWTIIGLVRLYVLLNHHPREAHLIQDMAVGIVYLGVALSIVAFVFDVPVGPLVATSGVAAIIFGLALQNTLGDVFSGIALTLGKAYAIGDWIQLKDGTEGRVVETNWRSTNLLTGGYNVVVVPNSVLARQGVTNLSRPDETHQITLTVRIATTTPRLVERVMHAALEGCTQIVKHPSPIVALKTIDAAAIEIDLSFQVESPAQWTAARNEIIDLLYDQCNANGLSFAPPAESVVFDRAAITGGYSPRDADTSSSRPVQHPVEGVFPELG